jgi:membrane protein required for colicin V production
MIWVDYAILGIIGLSALVSISRGFLREILSLAGWILASWVAFNFMHKFSPMLAPIVPTPSIAQVSTFVILFVAILFATGLINFMVGKLVNATGLSGTDRSLGIIFGIARGIVIVSILILVAGFTPLPQDPWWQESILIKHFTPLVLWLKSQLPAEVMKHLQF